MNWKIALIAATIAALASASPASADHEVGMTATSWPPSCNAVDVTTYDPYITFYWWCVDEYLAPVGQA